MQSAARLSLAWRAARQLGLRQIAWYAWYQVLLRSGYLSRATAAPPAWEPPASDWRRHIPLPPASALRRLLGEQGMEQAQTAAEEVKGGKIRLFGGPPGPLHLSLPPDTPHWTRCNPAALLQERHLPDIKYLWEPARFGWAFALGRAYRLEENPAYAAAFWAYAETFWDSNPPYRGPNWASGQEAALRLLALAWAGAVFAAAPASTPPRLKRLRRSLAEHAARIPPTLAYARAQNNNHLLSEAAGLLTAARLLPQHPQARRWQRLGRRWWRWGLTHQIAPDGEYIQHSANYHRLMLQLALWVEAVCPEANAGLPRAALGRASRWLLSLCDPHSGRVPNLGPNDGAYIFPLSGQPFGDYRPVLQAASRAFLGERAFPSGPWDEMTLWFLPQAAGAPPGPRLRPSPGGAPGILRTPSGWGYLRAVGLASRPGHADQLHLDLWHAGQNILLDPGTYLYNAPPPWDNALTRAAVHNTLTVDGQDQMSRAGRFLYLDWAQGEILARESAPAGTWERLRARHTGYRRLGIIHTRTVTAYARGAWEVEDLLDGPPETEHTFRLHWLLPDGEWNLDADEESAACRLRLRPKGWARAVEISIAAESAAGRPLQPSLARAGEPLFGAHAIPPWRGWVSPTYGVKLPALSLAVRLRAAAPVRFVTRLQVRSSQAAGPGD